MASPSDSINSENAQRSSSRTARRDRSPQSDPALSELRVPPHSIEAEQSVLGGLLLDNAPSTRSPM
jgi:hypothetical protein